MKNAGYRERLTQAVEATRADSVVNSTDNITMKEVDAEVAAVRTARRRKTKPSPVALGKLATQLPGTTGARAKRIKDKIVAGFYGKRARR